MTRSGQRAKHDIRITALDMAIARGLADADNDRTKPLFEVLDRLEAKYAAMASRRTGDQI